MEFNTNDGTAISPDDYNSVSSTITFQVGVTSATVTVSTVDDGISESFETFQALLENSTNGLAIGGQDTAIINIEDNGKILICMSDTDPVV